MCLVCSRRTGLFIYHLILKTTIPLGPWSSTWSQGTLPVLQPRQYENILVCVVTAVWWLCQAGFVLYMYWYTWYAWNGGEWEAIFIKIYCYGSFGVNNFKTLGVFRNMLHMLSVCYVIFCNHIMCVRIKYNEDRVAWCGWWIEENFIVSLVACYESDPDDMTHKLIDLDYII